MTYRVILFGAGASYGSDNIGTPPVGSDLFDALVSFNKGGWGQIPKDFADNFRQDFEDGMKNISKSNPQWMPPLQRAMAAYFYNFIPQPSNLYRELARHIIKSNWNGTLATINYERLLELSLIDEGLKPIVGRASTNSDEIELCLPHGCCHLFCEGVQGRSGGISFKPGGGISLKRGGGISFSSNSNVSFSGPSITTNGIVKVIENPIEFQSRIQNDAFPPVMSYFEPEKRTTSGASFIVNQRNRFLELVSIASIVGVVGVKIRPNDNHIWDPLVKTSARLIYCSGKKGGQEFDVWSKQNRPNNHDIILDGYFADCFEQLCKKLNID